MAKHVPNNVLDVGYVRGTISAAYVLRQRANQIHQPEVAAELLAMADVVENLTPDDVPIELIDTRTNLT